MQHATCNMQHAKRNPQLYTTQVLHRFYTGSTRVLHRFYTGSTQVLHRFYTGSTQVLHRFYTGSTQVLHRFYTGSTQVLHKFYTGSTQVLHRFYTGSTQVLHRFYTGSTQVLHRFYTGSTQVLHRFYTGSTQVLHRFYTGSTFTGYTNLCQLYYISNFRRLIIHVQMSVVKWKLIIIARTCIFNEKVNIFWQQPATTVIVHNIVLYSNTAREICIILYIALRNLSLIKKPYSASTMVLLFTNYFALAFIGLQIVSVKVQTLI